MATKRVPTTVSLYDGDKESLEEIVLNLGIKSISDLLRKIALGELIVVHADSADVPITPKNQQDATKLLIVESLLESALKAIKS